MQVTVTYNQDKQRSELLFNKLLPKEQATFLKEQIGLIQHFQNPKKWLAPNHPAYHKYATDLKEALAKGIAIHQVGLYPSFPPSNDSIDQNKFSYVSIAFNKDNAAVYDHYVLFDSYKKVATYIAEKFAQQKYGDALKEVVVHSRNYKRKARLLLKEGQIIASYDSPVKKTPPKEKLSTKKSVTNLPLALSIIPKGTQEPFGSGKTLIKDAATIQALAPKLLRLEDYSLDQATALELFELSQMAHPTDFGFKVTRSALLSEWVKRGDSAFKSLGFPIDKDYPYINLHTGFKSIYSLTHILGKQQNEWWSVIEHYRPLADPKKALEHIANEIRLLESQRSALINPKTQKPITKLKDAYQDITFDITSFNESKTNIQSYLNAHENPIDNTTNVLVESNLPPKEVDQKNRDTTGHSDYLDIIIAHMHDAYAVGQRKTKGQIIKLADQLSIPNKGMLWEAVELSWMLWYRNLYLEPIPFEQRLDNMIRFWQHVQPTYAYSDSSKEIYKQYSTPCPIGAIIAQYTHMNTAQSIFDPSAGNGLLLLGATPSLTHANEIDKTRLKSLAFQQFKTITSFNAAMPFPKELDKSFDVLVTNPPFAPWEESKLDKKNTVNKYFNKHLGLEQHMRLEHVMCGLALRTLKDSGKATLIIMGHIYFDNDGLIGKYRPFFNWLFRHYHVDDVINLNSFKLYDKQGAVERTMLILIRGRKAKPEGVAPKQEEASHFYPMANSFQALWERVKPFVDQGITKTIKQLHIALDK